MGDPAWGSGLVRCSQSYARVGGVWFATRNVPKAIEDCTVKVLSAHSASWDDFELVPLSEVERMVKLRSWASFRGARLTVERVWDGEGRMVWHPVRLGNPAYFASLLYVGPDTAGVSIAEVAEWPEFLGSDANYGGGVRGKVRLDRVEDYSEEFSEILIPGR